MSASALEVAAHDAKDAGLRHTTDADPGIRRLRRGRGFVYVGPRGRPVRDRATLARIRSLAVPPAWEDVWICPDPRGHLQATGRDARGRKQARYHPRWREVRDAVKFDRMVAFGRALPALRARVARDVAAEDVSPRCVVATIVRLLETTLIRVGNDEYARENRSYGLTTLRDGHVAPSGRGLRLRFAGKGGKPHEVEVTDARAARVVRECRDLPGQRLFQWVDDQGRRHAVSSEDVNAYLREATGEDFTAKDFRTWAGTVLALQALAGAPPPKGVTATRRAINAAVDSVAERLRNTRAVCRRSYVHPAVIRACEERRLARAIAECSARGPRGLRREEAVALAFLVREARGARRDRAAA
jgi:DNA topoisomerase-1